MRKYGMENVSLGDAGVELAGNARTGDRPHAADRSV